MIPSTSGCCASPGRKADLKPRPKRINMMEVAVFGPGRIRKSRAGKLVPQQGVGLKYVSDVNAQAAQELAARYSPQVAAIDTGLADPAIGAVLIASSTDTHADLLLRAAAAGKAIFCEKPV